MKFKLLFVALVSVTLLATSCSSPQKNGEKLGEKYFQSLTGYEKYTKLAQFRAKKDSTDQAIKPEFEKFAQKFAGDTEKMAVFYAAYNKWVDSAMVKYTSAFEKCVRTNLKDQCWYRENDPNKYHLYALTADSLDILNCKGKIAYRLHMDTLFFADANATVAVIDFPTDSTLTLTNANDTNLVGNYRKARPNDLIIGTWHYRTMQNVLGTYRPSWTNFKETGKYSGQEWQNNWYTKTSGSYKIETINDSTCYLTEDGGRNGVVGTMKMSSTDKFKLCYKSGTPEVFKRNKKGSPKSLDCLFDLPNKESNPTEVAKK